MDFLKKPLAAATSEIAQKRAADALQQTGMSLPAKVVEVIGPGIVKVSFEVDGGVVTLPQIIVPVQGSVYIYLPIQVGDLGVVQAATARLGGVTGLGAGVAGLYDTPGNLAALSFVWLGNKGWDAPVDPDALDLMRNILVKGDELGFFGHATTTKQAVTGALSAITDTNAKAVLTSLINALAAYGLITKSTT